MTRDVRIRLLGPFEVLREGTPAKLPPSKKARVLLAYLALADRELLRSRLCEIFWDVADDPRAGLRWCLSKLRAAVDLDGHKTIVANRKTVRFDPAACWTDVLHVRTRLDAGDLDRAALEELADCFRGELLEDQDLADLHSAQAWLVAQRSEARKLHGRVLSELVESCDARRVRRSSGRTLL